MERPSRDIMSKLFQAAVVSTGAASGDGSSNLMSQFFGATDLPTFFNNAFQIAISVGALLAMLRIAWAGYLYMGSADMWSNKQHAKDVFRDAIIGLFLLLGIWLILHQINPQLLNTDILQTSPSAATGATSGVFVS